ncbi:DMT family transporter [Bacillus massiliigorillae]|uniref:DMT family transporter n=1 Tax=Bacillus massiliigorillae TaxID=1243664 RepID=UPI0003A85CAD|nr:DMT family transporter [Bacillus massiliigorillae]
MKDKYPYLLLVLANIIWGGNFVVGNIGKEFFPPFTFSLLRWVIAFLILTPFMFKGFMKNRYLFWKYKWIILLLSFTGVAGYNTLIYYSMHWTTSINAAVINSITPIFIAILSIFILSEKISSAQIIGICFSVTGVLFTLSRGSLDNLAAFTFNKGDLLVIIAVLFWALYSILVKKYAPVLPTYSTFYVTTFIGSIMLVPFSLTEIMDSSSVFIFNFESIGILLYVGFLAAIVAFLSWNTGVPLVGAAKAGIYLNLLPIFAAIFAPIFTDEVLMWYQIVGGMIVIVGVLISSQTKKSLLIVNRKKSGSSY